MDGVGHGDASPSPLSAIRPYSWRECRSRPSIPSHGRFRRCPTTVGVELFGQRHGVVDVIEMAVGDGDGIDAFDLEALRVGGLPSVQGPSGWFRPRAGGTGKCLSARFMTHSAAPAARRAWS